MEKGQSFRSSSEGICGERNQEKKYAKELGIDAEQLKGFLGEAAKNEDEAIKKLFEESGLEEEEFAAEFKVSPERLKNILNPK